jgi:hypothetical protein
MGAVSQAFSPKEFKCAIISDATNAGTTGIGGTMLQLDVDSVSYPSLNINQSLDVRSGIGRAFKAEDFFQDNVLRVTELSLSGTLHNDAGHLLLLQNICNDVSTDLSVASPFVAASQVYGAAVANAASSLTVVIQPSDVTHQRGLEFVGCVVSNFSISADMGTEGGRYKWSATLQTGQKPDLNSTEVKYDNNTKTLMTAYDTQTAHTSSNSFIMTNNGKYGIAITNAVYTNVAYSEGDIMMLDISLKSVVDGSDDLVLFDVTA